MSSEATSSDKAEAGQQGFPDTSDRVADDHYDRGIVPAETAARREREGNTYKEHLSEGAQTRPDSVDTTEGYTVDKEGLVDNFAIEPEMYVNEPGDLKEEEEQRQAERAEELRQVNEDSEGDLTLEEDKRGRGPGIV